MLECNVCSTKKCYVCEGMKKGEADKLQDRSTGYACLSCRAVYTEKLELDESGHEAVKHLVQGMEDLGRKTCEQEEKNRRWREEWDRGEAKQLKCMLQRLTKLEEELQGERRMRKDLEKRVKQLEAKVKEEERGEREMEQKVKETVRRETATFAEKLKAHSTMQPGKVILKEVTERQDRGRNVVFRGIRESDGEGEEDRRKHDVEKLVEVAGRAGVDIESVKKSIIWVRRLGKREEGKNYRPLLVRLSSSDVRENLMRSNRALKEINRKEDSRWRIDPDLTKQQQDKLNEMWNEARKKTEAKNGIRYYVIGMENPELRSQRVEKGVEEERKK